VTYANTQNAYTHMHNCFLALWIVSGTPGWTGTRRNTYCGRQSSLICLWSMVTSLFNLHAWQSLSKFSLVYLLAWHPALHTPYISSPNHCLLFTAFAHTITNIYSCASSTSYWIYAISTNKCLHHFVHATFYTTTFPVYSFLTTSTMGDFTFWLSPWLRLESETKH